MFQIMARFWKVAKVANLWQNGQKWFILGLTFKVQNKTTITQQNAEIQT